MSPFKIMLATAHNLHYVCLSSALTASRLSPRSRWRRKVHHSDLQALGHRPLFPVSSLPLSNLSNLTNPSKPSKPSNPSNLCNPSNPSKPCNPSNLSNLSKPSNRIEAIKYRFRLFTPSKQYKLFRLLRLFKLHSHKGKCLSITVY